MKIIQITSEFPPDCGGIGYYVYYLSKYLVKTGHEVSVICRGSRDKSYYYERIPVQSVKAGMPAPFNVPLFKKRVEKLLMENDADIIHIHSTAMPAIRSKSPVVVTAHWCNCEGIRLFHRPIKDMDSLYRNIMLPVYKQVESRLVKSCDKLTVVSESLKKEFLKHYKVSSEVIYNGVDIDWFRFNKEQEKENAVLFTGKFSKGKGVIELLNMAELLLKSHPETTLYLIGEGPLRNRLKKQIEKKRLLNVKLMNRLSHSELINYYHRSMIYVLPSYYEGFPTTILEAMACELPVIATNISGISEQIEDGFNGHLIPAGNVKSLHGKIVDLLESPEKRVMFGKNGLTKILEKFTWQKVARKVEAVYTNLLH